MVCTGAEARAASVAVLAVEGGGAERARLGAYVTYKSLPLLDNWPSRNAAQDVWLGTENVKPPKHTKAMGLNVRYRERVPGRVSRLRCKGEAKTPARNTFPGSRKSRDPGNSGIQEGTHIFRIYTGDLYGMYLVAVQQAHAARHLLGGDEQGAQRSPLAEPRPLPGGGCKGGGADRGADGRLWADLALGGPGWCFTGFMARHQQAVVVVAVGRMHGAARPGSHLNLPSLLFGLRALCGRRGADPLCRCHSLEGATGDRLLEGADLGILLGGWVGEWIGGGEESDGWGLEMGGGWTKQRTHTHTQPWIWCCTLGLQVGRQAGVLTYGKYQGGSGGGGGARVQQRRTNPTRQR